MMVRSILLLVMMMSISLYANADKEEGNSEYCFEGRLCEKALTSSMLGPYHYVYDENSINVVTDYISIGYNLLEGNPEGEFSEGGLDPGLNLARKIFKFTFEEEKTGAYHGQVVNIPDQITFKEVNSCASKESVKLFSGTKSYQEKLDIKVKVEAGGSFGLFDVRFSTSEGYSQANQQTSKKKTTLLDKEIICSVGTVRYNLDKALALHYPVEDDFYFAVTHLPVEYLEEDYMSFLESWGTHLVLETNFGGRLLNRSQSSYTETYQYASESVQSSVSAGGSYYGYESSFEVDVNTFDEEVSSGAEFGSYQYTQYGGSTIRKSAVGAYEVPPDDQKIPIPITLKLEPITTALDKQLWENLTDDEETALETKQQNLKRALAKYAEWSSAPQSKDSPIVVPNAWPDGKYSLPKSTSGCAADSEEHFRWRTGYIHQDSEDSGTKNKFDNPHMAGDFGKNIKTEYCTKDETDNDLGLQWPRGTYCIAKRGGSCPPRFQNGGIFWDDEDSGNKNSQGGAIPDGSYSKNTYIEYCCRNDNSAYTKIYLPNEKPFYLYPYSSPQCQEVHGMTSSLEYVFYDDEDSGNKDRLDGAHPYAQGGRNINLYYCYYT